MDVKTEPAEINVGREKREKGVGIREMSISSLLGSTVYAQNTAASPKCMFTRTNE